MLNIYRNTANGLYEAVNEVGLVVQTHPCVKTLSRDLWFKGVEHRVKYSTATLTLG